MDGGSSPRWKIDTAAPLCARLLSTGLSAVDGFDFFVFFFYLLDGAKRKISCFLINFALIVISE